MWEAKSWKHALWFVLWHNVEVKFTHHQINKCNVVVLWLACVWTYFRHWKPWMRIEWLSIDSSVCLFHNASESMLSFGLREKHSGHEENYEGSSGEAYSFYRIWTLSFALLLSLLPKIPPPSNSVQKY